MLVTFSAGANSIDELEIVEFEIITAGGNP